MGRLQRGEVVANCSSSLEFVSVQVIYLFIFILQKGILAKGICEWLNGWWQINWEVTLKHAYFCVCMCVCVSVCVSERDREWESVLHILYVHNVE